MMEAGATSESEWALFYERIGARGMRRLDFESIEPLLRTPDGCVEAIPLIQELMRDRAVSANYSNEDDDGERPRHLI
eukprot:COSAG04_NODE_1276_length_7440_cov_3.885710_10_plen_76_part_01